MSRYAKLLGAVLGALGVIGAALSDGTVTPSEWAQIISSVVAAYLVWRVPNAPASQPPAGGQ